MRRISLEQRKALFIQNNPHHFLIEEERRRITRKQRRKELSDSLAYRVEKIHFLRIKGWTIRAIAKELDMAPSNVFYWLR